MTKAAKHNNQSWFDVAMEHYGDAGMAFDLAAACGASVTGDVPTEVMIPEAEKNQYITRLLASRIPATAEGISIAEGIGAWRIEYEFKVS